MTRKEKRALIIQAGKLLDRHCKNCLIYVQNKDAVGVDKAQRFCLDQCGVGVKLASIGAKLESFEDGWTTEEKFYLVNHAHLYSDEHLAKRLGKATTAVVLQRKKLGIYRKKVKEKVG